jgi:hypothetical protein
MTQTDITKADWIQYNDGGKTTYGGHAFDSLAFAFKIRRRARFSLTQKVDKNE